jgi:hypothetical protein
MDSAEDLWSVNKSLDCEALLSKEAKDFRRVNMSLDCEAMLSNTISAFELAVLWSRPNQSYSATV